MSAKKDAEDTQGHVFMSISNNIGHDNALMDTPDRNNLNDIYNIYIEWKRTGKIETVLKDNQDPHENLDCPEQVWLVKPEDIRASRLDAFYYAPDLRNVWSEMANMKSQGKIELKNGKNFTLRSKISANDQAALVKSGVKLKYIEIGDVTRYGLITKHIEDTLDKLPTRGEYMIHQGDILMAINNSSRGTVVLVPKEFDGAICTSGFLVIKPRSEDEGHLLWYSLRSEPVRKQLYYLAQTASQPELKKDSWEQELKIPIPAGKVVKCYCDLNCFSRTPFGSTECGFISLRRVSRYLSSGFPFDKSSNVKFDRCVPINLWFSYRFSPDLYVRRLLLPMQ